MLAESAFSPSTIGCDIHTWYTIMTDHFLILYAVVLEHVDRSTYFRLRM